MKNIRKIQYIVICAFCICLLFGLSQKAMAETKKEEISVNIDHAISGEGKFDDVVDTYEYTLNTDNTISYYELAVDPDNGKIVVEVFDHDSQIIYSTRGQDVSTRGTYCFKFNRNDKYYITISNRSRCNGFRYWLKEIKEEGDCKEDAEKIPINKAIEASICPNCNKNTYNVIYSDVDVYTFKTGAYQRKYTISLWSVNIDRSIESSILDKDGACIYKMPTAHQSPASATITLKANTRYYISLKAVERLNTFSYGLKVSQGSIVKESQSIKVSPRKQTIKYSKLKKGAQSFTLKVSAKTSVTVEKVSGNAKIKVSKKGKITLKKGLKKGTYSVKIKVKAESSKKYKAASKKVTIKITVK